MYTPILAALGFIVSPDGKNTLLVHRTARKNDHHYGKYNGLGGKMESGEDIVSCLKREIYEEAGIEARNIILRGTINWKGFGGEGEDWFGFIFLVNEYEGKPRTENNEGELVWKTIDELDTLPMWEGDRYFLPLVFDNDPRVFHGFMPYSENRPVGWSYNRL
jgi:8-oxo-dGTP diphosphatase